MSAEVERLKDEVRNDVPSTSSLLVDMLIA